MKLRFLPAVQEELEAAALYLDERAPGFGADLVGDVERIGELVCEFPQIGRSLDGASVNSIAALFIQLGLSN
jgi:plasmid stabilization system protein ParE